MGGIPCQIDEMIQRMSDVDSELDCLEQSLDNVESPEEAYNILKSKSL